MKVLIAFFVRFLLAPLLMVIMAFIMKGLSKGQSVFKMKKLIIFVLLFALVIALPSLLGFLKYEFVWGGIVISVLIYLLLGTGLIYFFETSLFKGIGLQEKKGLIFLAIFMSLVIGSWIYVLVFKWISQLNYSVWAMFCTTWLLLPMLVVWTKEAFSSIETPFYNTWSFDVANNDEKFWENVDKLRTNQVFVNVRRNNASKQYSSISAKIPENISIGKWFTRFIIAHNYEFPNQQLETDGEGGTYEWIFYTSKWFSYPLFIKVLDFEKNFKENNIKDTSTIYARRVTKKTDNANSNTNETEQ